MKRAARYVGFVTWVTLTLIGVLVTPSWVLRAMCAFLVIAVALDKRARQTLWR